MSKHRQAFINACLNEAHYDPKAKAYSSKGKAVIQKQLDAYAAAAPGDAAAELVWMANYLKDRKLPGAAQQMLEMLFVLTKPKKSPKPQWR